MSLSLNNIKTARSKVQKLFLFSSQSPHSFHILILLLSSLCSLAFLPGYASARQQDQLVFQTALEDELPPEAIPVITSTMAKDLPASYHLKKTAISYSMANPHHNLTMTFTEKGPEIMFNGSPWLMQLSGFGSAGAMERTPITSLEQHQESLIYHHKGLDEWYRNSHWGIEQGFTIPHPPHKGSTSEKLLVELTISGNIKSELQDNTLLLQTSNGQILRYSGLKAWDAEGHLLPAYLTLHTATLQIHVDTAKAIYPVTIDPWFQNDKLVPHDGHTSDFFGTSVAISGNTMVIGAPGDENSQGSAYVFVRQQSSWNDIEEAAKLTANDTADGDEFGWSVAISGNTVIVGAPGQENSSGKAYVFVRPDSGWTDMTETAQLTASDGVTLDYFGSSVAISAGSVAVGALGAGNYSGTTYLFQRPDQGWKDMTETAELTASDGTAGDEFGYSVSISGNTVVSGAPLDDGSGSAYIFTQPDLGWNDMTETAKLTASDATSGDKFGLSVAISADTVISGAPADDDAGNASGSAYIFVEPKTGWIDMNQTAKLTASDAAAGDNFGFSVAISGDTTICGAPRDDDKGNNSGSSYVFFRPEQGWHTMTETAKLLSSETATDDLSGYSVALSKDTVLNGALGDNSRGKNSGAAYVLTFSSPISYSGNGNTQGKAPLDVTPPQLGSMITVLGNSGNMKKSGRSFKCWNSAANGSGQEYTPGETFCHQGVAVTLYAQWNKDFYWPIFLPAILEKRG